MQKYVYFSIADRQLESFFDFSATSESAFEKSLVLNILFQPGILIPDIFCFISRGLENHLNRYQGRKSLFEAGIEKNVIVPAFRGSNVTSFQDVLYDIQGRGDPKRAIQGVQPNADEVARRLQLASDSSANFTPAYWPALDLGETFDQVVEKYLMIQKPLPIHEGSGINRRELLDLWSLTKRWRTDCIIEARNETQRIAGRGIRRGEIMNAVGRSLGLPRGHLVHDVSELFSLPDTSQEKRAIRLFCRWMTECYQFNQAVQFGSIASFPGFNSLESLIALSILPSNDDSPNLSSLPTIEASVAHPPLKLLLEIPPVEIFEIRNDLGLGYFASLDAWHTQPNIATEMEVRRNLRKYTDGLVEWTAKKRDLPSAILDTLHITKTERSQQIIASSLNILKTIPGAESLIVLFEEGLAIHQVYDPPKEFSEIEIKTDRPSKKLPEINVPNAGNQRQQN